MKKILAAIIVMLVIGLPIVSINVTAAKATIYVDDDAIPPCDGSKEHPYRYIQDAIDNATGADEINVANGTYYEHCTIYSDLRGLKILRWDPHDHSNDPDHYPPTLIGNGTDTGVTIEASNIEISDLTITNYGQKGCDAGIFIEWNTTNIRLVNNNISHVYTGIWIKRDNGSAVLVTTHTISNNYIHDITFRGISIILSDGNTISDNTIKKCHWGFYIMDTNQNKIQNNEITDCFEAGVIDVGMGNQVLHNTFKNNDWGFWTVNTKGSTINDNNFINNSNKPAGFSTFFILNSDHWSHNYWGRFVFPLCKPINGLFLLPQYTEIPWIRFDLFPAESLN